MSGFPSVAIVYTPWLSQAKLLAESLSERLPADRNAAIFSLPELEKEPSAIQGFSLLISVGGDGTILRIIRMAAPYDVPLVGVNLGRVGFMTELAQPEALGRINQYVQGEGTWVEERAMLEARVMPEEPRHEDDYSPYYGLNDVVIGRAAVARLVQVDVRIDGYPLATYAADAIIVATATGSTGYNLSAGGPIMYPESPSLLLNPVSAQLSLNAAVILHPDAVVDLRVQQGHPALFSIDGALDVDLAPGDTVRVKKSSYLAHFLRSGPHHHFPRTLLRRLGSPTRDKKH